MALVRTAVLLFAVRGPGNVQLRERLWYDHYFFHPFYGQAGYWLKQTDGERVLHGQVFDWLFYDDPTFDFSSRTNTANFAIKAFEQNSGVNFDPFDVVVVFLGIPGVISADSGSTTGKSKNRQHNTVVAQLGTSFDFVAHELGHALGLGHSFGKDPVPIIGENPGGYGHPFCIMSARNYGNTAAAYLPPNPRDNAPEYSGLGPSLNGLTARANGWIDAHVIHLGETARADFSIRARQWLGRMPSATPQGLEIIAADGSNFVVDFYEPLDWDKAQPGPALVVTQGRGGRAQRYYPNTPAGTYSGHIRLPLTFGTPGAQLRAGGASVQLLDYNPINHEVRVRVQRGTVNVPDVEMKQELQTLSAKQIETGITTWEPGEALCIKGSWSYKKMARSQEAVLEATYEMGSRGMAGQWSVDDDALSADATKWHELKKWTTVRIADPKFQNNKKLKLITLEYKVEPLPHGSRLRIRNHPADESFTLRVTAVLSNSFGVGSATAYVRFTGYEYVYEPRFYEERTECLKRFHDVGKRYRRYKVVLLPELWERIPRDQLDRVSLWLEALADHWERDEIQLYEQGVQALSHELQVPDLGLRVLSLDQAAVLPAIDREIAPPAPPDLAKALMGVSDRINGADRPTATQSWFGYLAAAALGAASVLLGIVLTRLKGEN